MSLITDKSYEIVFIRFYFWLIHSSLVTFYIITYFFSLDSPIQFFIFKNTSQNTFRQEKFSFWIIAVQKLIQNHEDHSHVIYKKNTHTIPKTVKNFRFPTILKDASAHALAENRNTNNSKTIFLKQTDWINWISNAAWRKRKYIFFERSKANDFFHIFSAYLRRECDFDFYLRCVDSNGMTRPIFEYSETAPMRKLLKILYAFAAFHNVTAT